jgi:hypothetical protein
VELSSEGFWARCGGELVSCIICGAQCSVRASRLLSPSAMIKLLNSANYNGNIVLKNVRCGVFLLLSGNQ